MVEEIELFTTRHKLKRRTTDDFVAITDHSTSYSVLKDLIDPTLEIGIRKNTAEDGGRHGCSRRHSRKVNPDACPKRPNEGIRHTGTPHRDLEKFIATAGNFYKPDKFATLYTYECTSIPNGANTHRHVSSEKRRRRSPFPLLIPFIPKTCGSIWKCTAITHNSNVSDGWMFSPNKVPGGPMDIRYARRQAANEPLFEICQTRGNPESHP
jgi:hypothetical protein